MYPHLKGFRSTSHRNSLASLASLASVHHRRKNLRHRINGDRKAISRSAGRRRSACTACTLCESRCQRAAPKALFSGTAAAGTTRMTSECSLRHATRGKFFHLCRGCDCAEEGGTGEGGIALPSGPSRCLRWPARQVCPREDMYPAGAAHRHSWHDATWHSRCPSAYRSPRLTTSPSCCCPWLCPAPASARRRPDSRTGSSVVPTCPGTCGPPPPLCPLTPSPFPSRGGICVAVTAYPYIGVPELRILPAYHT